MPVDTSTDIVMMSVDMSRSTLIPVSTVPGARAIADGEAEATARLLKALADPARIKIVTLLSRSEEAVCACMFTPALGLSQATVSHHLKRLTEAGLLVREQRGKWAFFTVDSDAIGRVADLLRFPGPE